MRAGASFFTDPASPAQRRYEAMRAYFVDELPAAQVADAFGYSTASVHQMATLLRSGRMRLFADARPGPRGPTKATGELRQKVTALRGRGLSVTQIARDLAGQGTPVSAQTVWKICAAEGSPPAARRRYRRPRSGGAGRAGQGRRHQRLARRAGQPALRPRRAAAAGPRHGRGQRPRADYQRRLPRHEPAIDRK